MINMEKAESEFNNYVKNYDLNNENINLKFHHSHRVKQIAEEIAKSLNLSEEEIKLAKLIGLLHDIARFEQYTRYQTFSDLKSIDHGDYGVEILKQNSFIRNFIDTDEYDNIIFKAIKNHNKLKIEDGLTEKELLYSKIVKDADILDIFYEAITMLYNDINSLKNIETGIINNEQIASIQKKQLIIRKLKDNQMEEMIMILGFAFDLNFKYSYEIMYKEDYINKIINRFNFKNEETRKKIEIIRNEINNYIQSKKG